ncbi:hypothetical protein ACQ4PT_042456 [Festuca glaucescens]
MEEGASFIGRTMGSSVTGTIFGRRRDLVHLALQTDPRAPPALMVELGAYSTGTPIRLTSPALSQTLPAPHRGPYQQREGRRDAPACVQEGNQRGTGRSLGWRRGSPAEGSPSEVTKLVVHLADFGDFS